MERVGPGHQHLKGVMLKCHTESDSLVEITLCMDTHLGSALGHLLASLHCTEGFFYFTAD